MLKTLAEAQEYAIKKVQQFTGEEPNATEKLIISEEIEEAFFEKVGDYVTEEDIEAAKLETAEQLEGYLFHKLPNYMALLEDTVAEFLSEYLSE